MGQALLLAALLVISAEGFSPSHRLKASFTVPSARSPLLHGGRMGLRETTPVGSTLGRSLIEGRIPCRSSLGFDMTASPPRENTLVSLTRDDLPMLFTLTGRFDTNKAYPGGLQNIHSVWDTMESVCGDLDAVEDPHFGVKMTYKEVSQKIRNLAGQLQELGLKKGDKLSVFSENSYKWLLLDGATLKCGAANVVRGAGATKEELVYIYNDSDSKACVLQTEELLQKLVSEKGGILSSEVVTTPEFFIVIDAEGKSGKEIAKAVGLKEGPKIVTMDELLNAGNSRPYTPVRVIEDDTATLLYTSGTTGKPKGVVLSHKNLIHQMLKNGFCLNEPYDPIPGDVQLSILPCWHIFERAAEYYAITRGVRLVYSSVRTFKADLIDFKPHFLIAVPRLFDSIHDGIVTKFAKESIVKRAVIELVTFISTMVMQQRRILENRRLIPHNRIDSFSSRPAPIKVAEKLVALILVTLLSPLATVGDKLVWSKVREGLGGRMKCLVSGGSLLSQKVDDFFEMVGQRMIVGYGLTETSPVICNRVTERNIAGTCGFPPPQTEVKICDVEDPNKEYGRLSGVQVANAKVVQSEGNVGVVWARGPQIMKGYYKQDDANAEAFDSEGFFSTGDLGRIDPVTGALMITGRAKDTIVLSNGENVEPTPIEEKLADSQFIDQVMLVGHDDRFLGALIVVNVEALGTAGLISQDKIAILKEAIPTIRDETSDPGLLRKESEMLNSDAAVKSAIMGSIKKLISADQGFREWESIRDVYLLLEPFTIANFQMTQTLKIKRNVVAEKYAKAIKEMYQK